MVTCLEERDSGFLVSAAPTYLHTCKPIQIAKEIINDARAKGTGRKRVKSGFSGR